MQSTAPSVLIVDDQPKLALMVHALLRRLGFSEIDMASDGATAMSMIAGRAVPYSLVICDLDMEPVDGLAVLKAAREDPNTARMPFILTEETFVHQDIAAAVNLGTDGILLKPYDLDVFRTKISKAVMAGGRPRKPREVYARGRGEANLPEMLTAYNA